MTLAVPCRLLLSFVACYSCDDIAMSSPPEFRRPHDPAPSERQQRSALCGVPVGGHACSSVISTLKLSLVEPVSTTRTLGALYRIATQKPGHDNRYKRQQQSQDMCWSRKSSYVAQLLRCLPSFLERDAIEGESPGASFAFTFL